MIAHDDVIPCPLNLGTFTNKLTTQSNCSLHEPSLAEHELRESPRKKLNSTIAETKGSSSLHSTTIKLWPHSQALGWGLGMRLVSYEWNPSILQPSQGASISKIPSLIFSEKNAFTWRLGQMSEVLLI